MLVEQVAQRELDLDRLPACAERREGSDWFDDDETWLGDVPVDTLAYTVSLAPKRRSTATLGDQRDSSMACTPAVP